MTITIVAVSIVAIALVGAVVYLVYFTVHRRVSSPFRHQRMQEIPGNNMEFSNRMFLQDDDEPAVFEELQASRNFVNPVYETMFQGGQAPIIKTNSAEEVSEITAAADHPTLAPEGEQSGLLRGGDDVSSPGRMVIHTDSD